MTQGEMNDCADQVAREAYSMLQSLITDLRSKMSAAQYTRFLELEGDWEKMIGDHCEWEAEFFAGGSIRPMQLSACLNEQYRFRIESLRLNLCEGNGMTGECEASLRYKQ